MQKTFGGADRFFPITYQKDWAVVRKIAEETGTPFNRAAYEKESAREEAARKKALEEKAEEMSRRTTATLRGEPRWHESRRQADARRRPGGALVIRGLRKEYRRGVPVLRDISITFPARGITAVIGPSGTGKSTLIRCINRLVEPTAGEILFHGVDLARLRGQALREARRRIGMVFQEYNLVERLTVMENVLSGRLGYVSPFKAWLRKYPQADINAAWELLDTVGLTPVRQPARGCALRAGSASASASRAPSCSARSCCSRTSPRPRSIRKRRSRSWSCWSTLTDGRGIPGDPQHPQRAAREALRHARHRHDGRQRGVRRPARGR